MSIGKGNSIILRLESLFFQYPTLHKEIIHNLNLDIKRGEIITFMAPSGTGKSTIFRLITGLEQPTSGSIYIDGLKSDNKNQKIGYMPQQDLLFKWRTILENVILPLELKGLSKKKRERIGRERMEIFGLSGTEKSYPHQLSGGMRQRANFLRATLSGESILLLDEPFSSLDAMTRLSMQKWLLEQWGRQVDHQPTLIFVSHDIDEALFLSDRVIVFTHSPLSTYKIVDVPFKRPRNHDQLLTSDGIRLKREIMACFDWKVQKS
ncbi:ABC transporter ATP-binding protein [Halalkalibacter nanhaiisediminis]|uniref:Putative hydroxymethylpyrimidine transport system ATP-binding protein n=1 Tax=Halalkalibacter nanhaiisediminis TaxID=688079 RepID=A0A562QM14_9BACI|nr:ABC transporter ATP-binding protein [Halalkalibacter nanhaiisediminis]TWI57792.1 putative hydroxymethylpyrimidine transport system ATP-binding protein [Halalkalibacter nanhaiisediminis]